MGLGLVSMCPGSEGGGGWGLGWGVGAAGRGAGQGCARQVSPRQHTLQRAAAAAALPSSGSRPAAPRRRQALHLVDEHKDQGVRLVHHLLRPRWAGGRARNASTRAMRLIDSCSAAVGCTTRAALRLPTCDHQAACPRQPRPQPAAVWSPQPAPAWILANRRDTSLPLSLNHLEKREWALTSTSTPPPGYLPGERGQRASEAAIERCCDAGGRQRLGRPGGSASRAPHACAADRSASGAPRSLVRQADGELLRQRLAEAGLAGARRACRRRDGCGWWWQGTRRDVGASARCLSAAPNLVAASGACSASLHPSPLPARPHRAAAPRGSRTRGAG